MNTIEIAERILPVYLKIQRAHKKDYSYAAQLTILQRLLRFRGIKKSRATLNRWLRRLEDEKYIKRIKRIKHDPQHGMIFNSTICIILMKGYHQIRRLGINTWPEIKSLLTKLKNKYPEMRAKETKRMLDAAKRNPKHPKNVLKTLTSLAAP